MGVRGLTTFIAANSNKYLKRHELHDTYLVIDGNNLAAQLYKWHAKCYDCFGGDYDKYALCVKYFFNLLRDCNVTPLIVFDGGYEDKKLKTIYSRMKTRVRQAKILSPANESGMNVFPLFLREVFLEVALRLNLKVIRCLVEADFEMACISRKLKCPVLSYDSDFYIFDVEYVPFTTLEWRLAKSKKDGYKYLECQVYRVEHFLKAFVGLEKECVPLLGVLLGNDYVRISVFRNFYRHLKQAKSKPGKSDQQRRIKSLIAWLQSESFDSALRKILGRIKEVHRKKVLKQILSAVDNYRCSESRLIKYFDLDIAESGEKPAKISIDIDSIEIETGDLDEIENDEESTEKSESESEELIENVPEAEAETQESTTFDLPPYFEENYTKCRYPASFIDIIAKNRYFFIPIIEDYYKPQCHVISLDILAAISAVLTGNVGKNLKYILRNERGRLDNFYLPKSPKILPSLSGLERISREESSKCLSEVLEIDGGFSDTLRQFPSSWRLYIICIVYWIRNCDPTPNECYIYALVLSALILSSVGNEFSKNEAKFLTRQAKDIDILELNPIKPTDVNPVAVKDILTAVTKGDKVMIMKELVSYFDMTTRLRKNPKIFDLGIIHVFAQFQSCAYHIKYLNYLLNRPFDDYFLPDFYNGTFIYNLTNNFLTRSQLDSYVEILTRKSPNIHKSFVAIIDFIRKAVTMTGLKNCVIKRRRKKKKKLVVTSNDTARSEDTEEDTFYDENNIYSSLKFVNE